MEFFVIFACAVFIVTTVLLVGANLCAKPGRSLAKTVRYALSAILTIIFWIFLMWLAM